MKKIWIIILNWNWYDDTIECIESLLNNSYKNIEIILIDNASKNDEWKKLQHFFQDKITFIQNDKNSWFAWWCNIWMKKALEIWVDYIMLFNNDAVAKNWFIEYLLESLESNKKIWIIWPSITYYNSDKIWFAGWNIKFLIWTPKHKWKWKKIDFIKNSNIYETEYVSWCCILIKKEVIEEIWLLDEEYFAYNEEVDFCYRARKVWYKCFIEPKSIIEHKKSASAWNKWSNSFSELQAYLIARNWVLFWKKNLSWFLKYWYLFTQYTILPILRIIFQIRSFKVFISYINWLLNKKCWKIN